MHRDTYYSDIQRRVQAVQDRKNAFGEYQTHIKVPSLKISCTQLIFHPSQVKQTLSITNISTTVTKFHVQPPSPVKVGGTII
jgi:hypothetical protein